jgi:hypothetical protein
MPILNRRYSATRAERQPKERGVSQPQRLDQASVLRLRQPRSVEIGVARDSFGRY